METSDVFVSLFCGLSGFIFIIIAIVALAKRRNWLGLMISLMISLLMIYLVLWG